MIRKVAIKNPGCQFCKFYLASFKYRGRETNPACAKGARRIYLKGAGFGLRKWKWVDCLSAEHKNKTRFCADFEVDSIFSLIFRAVLVLLHRGGPQTPPALRREMWWNEEDHF